MGSGPVFHVRSLSEQSSVDGAEEVQDVTGHADVLLFSGTVWNKRLNQRNFLPLSAASLLGVRRGSSVALSFFKHKHILRLNTKVFQRHLLWSPVCLLLLLLLLLFFSLALLPGVDKRRVYDSSAVLERFSHRLLQLNYHRSSR